jgi:hypothetical protein
VVYRHGGNGENTESEPGLRQDPGASQVFARPTRTGRQSRKKYLALILSD